MPAVMSATPGGASNWTLDHAGGAERLRSRPVSALRRFQGYRQLLRAACKAATITCCRTASSSAPRPTQRFPAFPTALGISIGGALKSDVADARRGDFQRDGADFRHRARPHRLCSRQLAVLCDGRLRLELRSADAHAGRHRRTANSRSCGDWAGRRRRRRSSDRAALDGAARISVHRLRQQRHDVFRRRRSGSIPTSRCTNCAPA